MDHRTIACRTKALARNYERLHIRDQVFLKSWKSWLSTARDMWADFYRKRESKRVFPKSCVIWCKRWFSGGQPELEKGPRNGHRARIGRCDVTAGIILRFVHRAAQRGKASLILMKAAAVETVTPVSTWPPLQPMHPPFNVERIRRSFWTRWIQTMRKFARNCALFKRFFESIVSSSFLFVWIRRIWKGICWRSVELGRERIIRKKEFPFDRRKTFRTWHYTI